MKSIFDIQKLESLLRDFYTITHVRITVFNEYFEELIAYPRTLEKPCMIIRTDCRAHYACRKSDRQACEKAKDRRSPYIYRCHAGFTEAISPIHLGNVIIGYLFLGQLFSYENRQDGYANILRLCKDYQIDHELLLDACKDKKNTTEAYILSASRLLEAVATFLCMERMAVLKEQPLPVQIDTYINENLSDKISIDRICSHFQIGRTQLCNIAKQNYGKGIAAHIRDLRIERATKLLEENPNARIADIAYACGFNDYNHFFSLFKTVTGMTPRQFQKASSY